MKFSEVIEAKRLIERYTTSEYAIVEAAIKRLMEGTSL